MDTLWLWLSRVAATGPTPSFAFFAKGGRQTVPQTRVDLTGAELPARRNNKIAQLSFPRSAPSPATFAPRDTIPGVSDSACIPSSASAVPATTVTSRHSALVRVTHWITTLCFFALLVSGIEIVISHPRFYWGETGNVLTPSAVRSADPGLAAIGADRLRVRAAGPERLEPVSPLSSRLGCWY